MQTDEIIWWQVSDVSRNFQDKILYFVQMIELCRFHAHLEEVTAPVSQPWLTQPLFVARSGQAWCFAELWVVLQPARFVVLLVWSLLLCFAHVSPCDWPGLAFSQDANEWLPSSVTQQYRQAVVVADSLCRRAEISMNVTVLWACDVTSLRRSISKHKTQSQDRLRALGSLRRYLLH